jgi:hypothetical protein
MGVTSAQGGQAAQGKFVLQFPQILLAQRQVVQQVTGAGPKARTCFLEVAAESALPSQSAVADLLDAFHQKVNRRAVQELGSGLADGQRGDRPRLGAVFAGGPWDQGGAFHARCFVSEKSHL